VQLISRLRLVIAVGSSLALGACGDAPTGPQRMTAEAAALALPSINDARLRLVDGLASAPVRERVRSDLEQIELALMSQNARAATFRARLLRSVLIDYASREGAPHADEADLVAIGLALNELFGALGLPFDVALLI